MKKLASLLLFLAFGFISNSSIAQKIFTFKKDFQLNSLRQMKDDTNKINAYIDKSWLALYGEKQQFFVPALDLAKKLNWQKGIIKIKIQLANDNFRKPDMGKSYAEEAYHLAIKYHFAALQYQALTQMARIDERNKQYVAMRIKLDSSISYFELAGNITALEDVVTTSIMLTQEEKGLKYGVQAVDVWKHKLKKYSDSGNKQLELGCLMILSDYYYTMADFPKTLAYQLQQLSFFKPNDRSNQYGDLLSGIGTSYESMGNYAKALEYFKKLAAFAPAFNGDPGYRSAESLIADIYSKLEDHPAAIKYRLMDMEKIEKANDLWAAVRTVNAIAADYIGLKEYYLSLRYLKYGLTLSDQLDNSNQKARVLCTMVWVNYLLKNYTEALKLTSEQFKIDSGENSFVYHQSNFRLGSIYREAPDAVLKASGIDPKKKFDLSIQKLTEGLAYFKKRFFVGGQKDAQYELKLTYYKKGDYKRAYDAFSDYQILRDSLNGQNKQKEFRQKEAQFQFEKESQAIRLQQQLTNVQLHNKQVQSYYFIVGIILLLALSVFVYRSYKRADLEKQRSDDLLLNILPADVAEELKEKGSANARLFDEVTVLFTDFVNFTTISELLTPQELVDELHHCFKAFDGIMTTHHIEKIKTIGDAYLAVAGLPTADAMHATNTIKAALEIRAFIQQHKIEKGNKAFDIRIGIHSGSVVAGIVGVKKFAYDIWGDTVNTAARMEQNSEPGKINISEETYELVKDKFSFTYRGEIEAKNKGMMKMYFVNNNH